MGDTLVAYLHGDALSASFHQSLAALREYDDKRFVAAVGDIRTAAGALVHNRNEMMAGLLNGGYEWLLIVDADMGFAPNALEELRLVADPVERPVVGALCFSQADLDHDGRSGYRWRARPSIWDFVECDDGLSRMLPRQHYRVNTLVKCDGTGAAFLLVHRSVAMKVLNKYGPHWFDPVADCDGAMMGEDLSFSWRLMQLGVPVFVFTGVKTTHHKSVWLGEDDFWTGFPVPPALERVDVIVPVLHRPQNVEPFMRSLTASTGLAYAYFVCEPGDDEERSEVIRCGGLALQHGGSFAQKVNYAYGHTQESLAEWTAPWIFPVGDDVRFHPGWLDHAQFVAKAYGGDVIGTNDLGNDAVRSGDHSPHWLIRRSYIDEHGATFDDQPGVVCSEEYRHWFVDNELVLAAKRRGAWRMALGSIVEHMHPQFGRGEDDDIYQIGRDHAEEDRLTFLRRRAA